MTVRVAVAQTAPTVGELDDNLDAAVNTVASLAGAADLVIFPELFTTGYRREGMDHRRFAEPIEGGRSVERLQAAAAEASVAVIGTVLELSGERVYDTAVVIGTDGNLSGRYRKSHLYPDERTYFGSGDQLEVVDAGVARVGLAICFEHGFPEIFTELALRGAELIAIPSAVPTGYEYLLELRTRARAQDNQVFVAASNLVGFDGVTTWCGRSMIVGPRGQVLAAAGPTQAQVIIAEIDVAQAVAEREQEPVLLNRRPTLYSHLTPS